MCYFTNAYNNNITVHLFEHHICFVFLQENVDPALQAKAEEENQPIGDQQAHKRELTEEDEHEIWKEIALTQ